MNDILDRGAPGRTESPEEARPDATGAFRDVTGPATEASQDTRAAALAAARHLLWPADATGRILRVILAIALLKGFLWAVLGQDVPDEPSFFQEVSDFANFGTSKSYSGHVVGVFAAVGSRFLLLGQALGLDPLLSVRLLGVLCTVLVAWLGYRTARSLFPNDFLIQLSVPSFLAFNPMYSFIGSSANSDTMVVMWSTLFLLLLVLIVRDRVTLPRLVVLGVSAVLAAFTKERFYVLLPLLVPATLFVPIKWRLDRYEWSGFWEKRVSIVEVIFTAAVVVGMSFGWRPLLRWVLTSPIEGGGFGRFLPLQALMVQITSSNFPIRMFREFWGYFGYLHLPATPTIYAIQAWFLVLAAAGLLIALLNFIFRVLTRWEETIGKADYGAPLALLILVAAVLLALYGTAQYHVITGGRGQGRYLFIVIMPIYLLMSLGIARLIPEYAHRQAFVVVFGTLLGVNLASLLYVIVPYFY